MTDETDPAETPEDTTTADPQAEEDAAESEEQSEEGAESSEDQGRVRGQPDGAEDADEIEIVVEGEAAKAEEPAPKDAKAWAKARAAEREAKAEIARLRRELDAKTQPVTASDPGKEPTLEDPDVQWDEKKLLAKHSEWLKATERHEAEKTQASQKAQKARDSWEANKATIVKSRNELIKRMPGYVEAEANVDTALAGDKLGKLAAIMHVCGAKTPMVIAALGRDPARLKDLADEDDMPRFIAKVAKLEDKVQEKKKGSTPPPPEKKIGGTGGASGAVDAQEERLIEQAMKSGNVDALRAYQKAKRKK